MSEKRFQSMIIVNSVAMIYDSETYELLEIIDLTNYQIKVQDPILKQIGEQKTLNDTIGLVIIGLMLVGLLYYIQGWLE